MGKSPTLSEEFYNVKDSTKRTLITIAVIAVFTFILYTAFNSFIVEKPEKIGYNVFLQKYEDDLRKAPGDREFKEIRAEVYSAELIDKDGKAKFFVYIYCLELNGDLLEIERAVKGETSGAFEPLAWFMPDLNSNTWLQTAFTGLGFVAVIVIFILISRQMGGGGSKTMNFGRVKTKANENVKVKFADVAGAEEEKEELKEIVEFLKTPKKFSELGARIPKGVLLVGPPGTGKTLFAKAVAGEANVPFFSISGSDFVEMFVGVGASRVRDLFDLAKKSMPCIVFIDEIDAVGRQRGTGLGGGHDEREQTLNQLLVQMDGFETNEGIIIMAATNRADILDPALLRPGRFDRQIYVHVPDVRGREAIFKVHARNKPLSPEVNFRNLARMTSGFTGADIENLLNEAAILAARAGRKQIIMKDVYEGINKVIAGPQKKSRLVTESDKRITAFHEAGHAIVIKSLRHSENVHEVTIIPRGQAAGYTMLRPDSDDNHVSKSKLLDTITGLLGGRVAEEIMIQDICTGAENDLQRATGIARKMVTEWGMSALGTIYYGSDREVFIGRDFQAQHTYSEQVAASVDAEVNKIMQLCYKRAHEVLEGKVQILENMARLLIERETIISGDVDMLMNGASVEEVAKAMDERAEREQKEAQAERAALQRTGSKPPPPAEPPSDGKELPH